MQASAVIPMLLALAAATLGTPPAATASAAPMAVDAPPPATPATVGAPSAAVAARRLGRGMNALNADPLWEDLGRARFGAAQFTELKRAGFSTLRVNLSTFRHLDADGRLDPHWLESLDWVVSQGTAAGLNLILEVQDMKACAEDVAACRPKLLAVWRTLSERYADAPPTVLFEPLNEPNNAINPVWNDLAADVLNVIRRTNPDRNVVIDTENWASVDTLELLRLPAEDRHLIASIHYYEPRSFTHQGVPWDTGTGTLTGVRWRTRTDGPRVRADLRKARAWARANGRPVYLGEFGAYERADMGGRARYFRAVAREAESLGLSWAYWQFDGDFTAWDWSRRDWIRPVLKALVPGSPALSRPGASRRRVIEAERSAGEG